MNVKVEILGPSERSQIMQALTELCAEQGYAQTSVEQITERAGVSPERFSDLFQDKDDCMVAAVNAILGELVAVVSGSYSVDRSEWDSTFFAVKSILDLMAANPSVAHLMCIASRQMGPPRVRGVHEAGIRILTALMERLWEYSESEVQPAGAARAALGGAEAVVRREIMAGRTEQLPGLLPDFVFMAAVPFLGQEEALRLSRRARKLLRGTEWDDGLTAS